MSEQPLNEKCQWTNNRKLRKSGEEANGVTESTGDVISGLGRLLAGAFANMHGNANYKDFDAKIILNSL
jgi:hypothetical protein